MRLREVFQQSQKQVLREGIAHPEDMIINGVVAKDSAGKNYHETRPGAEAANRAIDSIAEIETDPETVSVKWDGFPAVVFGRDENGDFVFVDKHQFDKAAKGKAELSTIEEYDKSRGANRTNLWQAEKILRPAVEATVPSVNDRYWMGDLMWTGTPKEDGDTWVFKPNTVEYRVNKQGELGKQIGSSRAGIAVHTFYPGLNASDQALTGLEGLDPNGAVTYLTGEMKDKPQVSIDQKQIQEARNLVKQHAGVVDKFIQDLTQMKAKAVITAMGPFITRMLEEDDIKNNIVPRFLEFLEDRLSESAKKKMLGDDKDGWLYAEDGGGPGLLGIWTMWAAVTDLKMQVKTQIDDQQQGSEVEAIIDGDPAHEGYVFGQGSAKIKLVDRLGFSKANFSKHKVPDEEVAQKAQMDKAAFCFGRMNPPTLGHKQLMQSTIAAGGSNSYIFVSSKTDPKTDPLDPEVKKAFIKQIYPSMGSYVVDDFVKTPIEAANYLYDKGFRNMTFIAGSDRLGNSKGSLEKILTSWNSGPVRSTDHARGENGREYVNLEFESSGERDPDAEGLSGISGSLARKLASEGNENGFEKATGVDSRTRVGGRTLYTATREGMGIRDAKTEEIQMKQPELREYINHLDKIIGDRLIEMTEAPENVEHEVAQVIQGIEEFGQIEVDIDPGKFDILMQAAQKGDFDKVADIMADFVRSNEYAEGDAEAAQQDALEEIKAIMGSGSDLKKQLADILKDMQSTAQQGEDVTDMIADELGDLFDAVQSSDNRDIQKVYRYVREKLADRDPKDQARGLQIALNTLGSTTESVEEAQGQGIEQEIMQTLEDMQSMAQQGEDVTDQIADELGDYFNDVQMSGNKDLKKVFAFVREKLPDATPKQQARGLQQAIARLGSTNESVKEARANSNGKMVQALAKLFVKNGFISTFVNDGENVQTLIDYADGPAADKLASVFNRLEPQEQDQVADELVDAMVDIHGDPYDFLDDPGELSMYDSEEIKQAMSNKTDESTFEDFDDEESEEEPVNKGFTQSPMYDQLGKVLDSEDTPNPVNTVTTDDGETFEVNQDQARALRLLATTEKVKPDVKQEFLKDIQNSQGLSDYLDQTDYHEMAHLFVKRYLA